MITSADLIIDINIHAASSLEGALLSLSITPSSAESDENFKPWAHVSADTIHAELLGCLRSADAAGFFRRLASLSRSYELIRRASADPVSLTSQWSAAAAALEHAIGVPAERCCEGLRSGYYIPPGHQGLGGNYEVLVCLRSVSEDDAAPPELQLELSPPLVVTEEVGRDLKALAAGDAAVAGGPAKTAKSGEAWLSALVEAPVTAAAGGMGVTTHGEIPMDAQGAEGCRGSVLRYAVVPLNGGIHRQKWELTADPKLGGALIRNLPLCQGPEVIGQLMGPLRKNACFDQIIRSCLCDPLLPPPPPSLRSSLLPTETDLVEGVGCSYSVEVQAQPPSHLGIITRLPAGDDAVPTMTEIHFEISQPDEGTPPRSIAFSARSRHMVACGSVMDALSNDKYASTLLTTSHSLPLTLAYVAKRNSSHPGTCTARPNGKGRGEKRGLEGRDL